MTSEKARAASDAKLALIAELAKAGNKDGFEVAIVDFADSAALITPLTPATALATRPQPLEGGMHWLRPVTLLFTDGKHNRGPGPQSTADALEQLSDLVYVAFGNDADEAALYIIATSPQHVYRCTNGAELRSFLAAVGRTLSATMRTNTNATQALSVVLL